MMDQEQVTTISLHDFFSLLFASVPYDYFTTIIGFNGKSGAAFIESFTVDAIDKIVECINMHRDDPRTNIYFRTSFLAERPPAGKRGDEEATVGSDMLWLDLDIYNTQKTMGETLHALESFTPKPTVIWSTGRGIQAAWLLNEFCVDKHRIKAINKWLEEQFVDYGSDNTSDLSRVFRVPTTYNHKTTPPSVSKVEQMRMDRIYAIKDFGWSAPEPFVFGEPINEEVLPEDFLERVRKQSPMVYDRIYSEKSARDASAPLTDGGRIDRSKNDWFIACSLLTLGYTKGQIMSVLTHPVWFSGARFRERRNYYYINLTLQKAVGGSDTDIGQYFEGKRFIPGRMYEALLKNGTHFLRLSGMEESLVDGIWYYDNGVYSRNGEQFIKEEIVQRLGTFWASRHAEETIKYVRAERSVPVYNIYAEPVRYGLDALRINTLSGLLNVATGRLEPHTPEQVSFIQIPVRYNPDVRSTRIADFIRSVIPHDAVLAFWEFVGYCLLQDCRYKKALFLIGPRDTGKSTILDLLKRFLGQSNTVSTKLQDITDSRFDAVTLLNKLANIFPDLPATELKDAGMLKAITSGDPIKGERKYENPVSFYPTAKHIYSANAFVPTADPEIDAFVERWLVIPLGNTFSSHAEATSGRKANTRLIDELATPINFSEMLNLAIAGLVRLLRQDGFSEGDSQRDASNDYRGILDSVYAFLLTQTEVDEEGYIIKDEMIRRYQLWCHGSDNRRAVGEPKFFRRMKYLVKRPELSLSEGKKSIVREGVGLKETHVYRGRRLCGLGGEEPPPARRFPLLQKRSI